MPASTHPGRSRNGNWIIANSGNVYYRTDGNTHHGPSHGQPQSQAQAQSQAHAQGQPHGRPPTFADGGCFPAPLIGPRRSRPHSIHITTYPPGYVPRELRPRSGRSRSQTLKVRTNSRAAAEQHRRSIAAMPSAAAVPSAATMPSAAAGALSAAARHHAAAADLATPTSPTTAGTHDSYGYANTTTTTSSALSPYATAPANSYFPSAAVSTNADNTTAASAAAAAAARATDPPPPVVAAKHSLARPTVLSKLLQSFSSKRSSAASPQVAAAAAAADASRQLVPPPPAYDDVIPNPEYHPLRIDSTGAAPVTTATPSTATTTANSSSSSSSFYAGNAYSPTSPSPSPSSPSNVVNLADAGGLAMAAAPAPAVPRGAPDTSSSVAPIPRSRNRNSIMSVRSTKSAVASLGAAADVSKPVASGSGVACSILLAEPNVFLSGFSHDSNVQRGEQSGTALLRGRLQLKVSKNVKLKAIQLKLVGRARTDWPEGIPPLKQDVFEEESLRTQVLTFFNAMNDGWETEYGDQCSYRLRAVPADAAAPPLPAGPLLSSSASAVQQRSGLSARELKRLSLQSVHTRSFGKGDHGTTATQAKGYKVFYPGVYDYTFELPIDHHQLETTKLRYGSVRWELHATVDRAGAFKPNLHGMKEVSIVRLPDQMSLETTEPISISRQWEDQLHYDIVISGKSFPIGSKIPIAFKLTPLAKVQVHKIKVYVTESVEYWTNDRRVARKDPGRKILLVEKSAGKPLDPTWASSEINTVRGGEPSAESRREAREVAQRRRITDAARRRTSPEPLPEPAANLLGDLDLGLESMWGSTEIEANVQIPTCEMMAKNKDLALHPDCSWKNVNVYHWIKIVMRISRPDHEDPTGTRRRHFEISIDSPFTVLNCRATHANTNLPAYAGPTCQPSPFQAACGCPDSASVMTDISPSSSTGTLAGGASVDHLPVFPQSAHLPHGGALGDAGPAQHASHGLGIQGEPRPIHLMRAPSFDPPAFDDDVAPPPAIVVERPDAATPPPHYDAVVGTPSVDGLADYFSRLANHGLRDEDSASDSDEQPPRILNRSGRVNVLHPRTPGGRMPSRSMEISRPQFLTTLPMRSDEV
ncbi:hypothetical protein RJ55_07581 [Drechmeria coniospora]|nr:hypothetical protein RJ55_07581 [Drechmeria coniospora]